MSFNRSQRHLDDERHLRAGRRPRARRRPAQPLVSRRAPWGSRRDPRRRGATGDAEAERLVLRAQRVDRGGDDRELLRVDKGRRNAPRGDVGVRRLDVRRGSPGSVVPPFGGSMPMTAPDDGAPCSTSNGNEPCRLRVVATTTSPGRTRQHVRLGWHGSSARRRRAPCGRRRSEVPLRLPWEPVVDPLGRGEELAVAPDHQPVGTMPTPRA